MRGQTSGTMRISWLWRWPPTPSVLHFSRGSREAVSRSGTWGQPRSTQTHTQYPSVRPHTHREQNKMDSPCTDQHHSLSKVTNSNSVLNLTCSLHVMFTTDYFQWIPWWFQDCKQQMCVSKKDHLK